VGRCLIAVVLVSLVAALVPASAAGSYDSDFRSVNTRLVKLGTDVNAALQSAEGKSGEAINAEFGALAGRTRGVRRRLVRLDPPARLAKLHRRLARSLKKVAADLSTIARAGRRRDVELGRLGASRLTRHSRTLRKTRRALVKRTG